MERKHPTGLEGKEIRKRNRWMEVKVKLKVKIKQQK